jgi:hypothetical protein
MAITIPEKHYLGCRQGNGKNFPLGFMTPYGTDAAAKKRMAAVDAWLSGNYYTQGNKTKTSTNVLDNTAVSGFKFSTEIRTTNYYDHWRIEDPRGFELEISSGNLAQLMNVCTIENGTILEQCVWGRNGVDNVLLSVTSQAYKDAVEATRVKGTKASWKDVKVGNLVLLQNSRKLRWLGKMAPIHYRTSILLAEKKYHIFSDGESIELFATPKLSEILDQETKTPQEVFDYVNDGRDISSNMHHRVFALVHSATNIELVADPVTYASFEAASKDGARYLFTEDGKFGTWKGNDNSDVEFISSTLSQFNIVNHDQNHHFLTRAPGLSFKQVKEFAKIMLSVETPNGRIFKLLKLRW